MSLADQIIGHGPYDATVHPRYGAQTYSFTGASLNELRDELMAARTKGPCSETMPSLILGQPDLGCDLPHGRDGDHTDWSGSRWRRRTSAANLSRFEIEGDGSETDSVIVIRCGHCKWTHEHVIQSRNVTWHTLDLAELVRRAAEHTEVCR